MVIEMAAKAVPPYEAAASSGVSDSGAAGGLASLRAGIKSASLARASRASRRATTRAACGWS